MKIAILHLSDFHVCDNDRFANQKIDGVLSSLNSLGKIDDFVVAFSGDLSQSGQINEYKKSRYLFNRIIAGIKQKNDNKFVNVFMVPGNHDLCLPNNARERRDIQEHYNDNTIEDLIPEEAKYLENYYMYSNTNGKIPYDIFLSKRFCSFEGYNIQFNLLNTAPFSTLEPDDKELHYFPDNKIYQLNKSDDANICITVMHHSYEWFHWNYKSNLEKAIIDNSEFLFYGHDHRDSNTTLSIDNGIDSWISSAGAMKFTSLDYEDSFNIIVIDTENNSFDGYVFTWDKRAKIYGRKIIVTEKSLQNHSAKLSPLPSFIKSIKEDNYNVSDDFTKYFVFPKLVSESQKEKDKIITITNTSELKELIHEKKNIIISGSSNSGKTTLLKHLYCSVLSEKTPLFLSADNKQRIKINNFIKHLFEEQYGDDPSLYDRYLQLDLDKKILIIDGWDLLNLSKNHKAVIEKIQESFGFVVFSVSNLSNNIVDSIKNEISNSSSLFELRIRPFFAEKRNELVKNICMQRSTYNDESINNVNKLIDTLVQNNSGLFSLNPAFIVRYTNCLIQDPYQDYAKGESVFSKVFEHELSRSIIQFTKDSDADDVFTVFEEIAGYMFVKRKDILTIEELKTAIQDYNSSYGENINIRDIIAIGLKAKVLKQTEDLSIFFLNKNHLSYFIAKYLIRMAQSDPADTSGIEYVLQNICFGINSDIVLFISYIMNNTKIISSIASYAGELLQPWDALNFSEKNISILHRVPAEHVIPPTDDERKKYEVAKEITEENNYSEEVISSKGLFDYDDTHIDQYKYRLDRAIKYTEILCKALPAFHNKLKLEQKKYLIENVFLYPRKIIYALLRPLDMDIENICNDILLFAKHNNIKKKNNTEYKKDDVIEMLNDASRAVTLSLFDHFSFLATTTKTFDMLVNKTPNDISEKIQRLLIIEAVGKTDLLMKESENLLKIYKGTEYDMMIKLIVRKHLLTNRDLTFSKKQQIIDRVFGKSSRKYFLTH